jgi:hypothetical protein
MELCMSIALQSNCDHDASTGRRPTRAMKLYKPKLAAGAMETEAKHNAAVYLDTGTAHVGNGNCLS